MMDKLEKILMPMAEAIGRNKYLIAIRDGFLVSTPLLIVGSIFLLLANFPIQAWTDFIANVQIGSSNLATLLSKQSDATFTIMRSLPRWVLVILLRNSLRQVEFSVLSVSLMSWFHFDAIFHYRKHQCYV